MSGITTHVLDTSRGQPAAGMTVRLFHEGQEIASAATNADGRCRLLAKHLVSGTYRVVFETGAYFPEGFYPQVTICFLVRDGASDYHVPLLISPFGYATYRGS